MTSSVKTVFLEEQEKDIFQALRKQGIDTHILENRLSDLFQRVYNNNVGYYAFRQNGIVYKLVVLPKTIDPLNDTAEKDFVNYLLHYYRVNLKYKFDQTKMISDSLLSLAFESNNKEEPSSHNPIDEFEFYKYLSMLDKIEYFFKKHKNYTREKIDYISQSVKHRLNLNKNIKELDKSKIHQSKTVDLMYSQMATIAHYALILFKAHKLDSINNEYKEEIISKVRQVDTFIVKKYHIDKAYKFTLSKLNGFKIAKVFNANLERKNLLTNIKSLFGFEQMYRDGEVAVENRYDLTTNSFFIDPIRFYEWYVYDILKKYTDANKKEILFAGMEAETTTQYKLFSKIKPPIDKESKPDYILIDKEKNIKIVLDAKWKKIDKLSHISSADYLKLKHDALLLDKDNFKTISYLIYPQYIAEKDDVSIQINTDSYFDFHILEFDFHILEIDMNFENDKNSIDFVYDFEELQREIDEEVETGKIEYISEKYSHDIQVKRTEFITEILNSDSAENSEDAFSGLDAFMLEESDEFNQNIEEYISQDVQELLDEFEGVLAEDSKKFLKSSSSIYRYCKDKKFEHFDYSMPGSGLWKLVELELNTSFVWYIRIQKKVCSYTCPWSPLFDRKTDIAHQIDKRKRVRLNQYEPSEDKLQGVMLGGIKLLMSDQDIKEYFTDFVNVESYVEEDFIQQIIDFRNEHAHIKAMTQKKYEELDRLLFSKIDGLSFLHRLLTFKRIIQSQIQLMIMK